MQLNPAEISELIKSRIEGLGATDLTDDDAADLHVGVVRELETGLRRAERDVGVVGERLVEDRVGQPAGEHEQHQERHAEHLVLDRGERLVCPGAAVHD